MLKLPNSLRKELKKPLGELHKSINLIEIPLRKQIKEEKLIIAIGDVTSKNLVEIGIQPQLCIVDNLTKRKPIQHNLNHTNNIIYVDNPAGVLTEEFIKLCSNSIQEATNDNPIIIEVNGEEDLAVLPCVINSPIDTFILYGQPNEGVVLVRVEEAYDKALNYYKQLIKE
ncbi:DUF359 domain-containing protein [Methanosphaera sp. ISO3-F5]|uniref:GTP-dependent dephospho-CoA kinase family protein n=1 Tax=Methanosphaera sp. ISO3-F5 TaxID=1452353 RepID=UPI002B25AE5F|nr:DUF359 domain-containing protein [Methanosphaera sp. ISO3-F5]WQH63323.1 DUF359 domain-containing protein [Methanosphaera sp. ISO3-F5]